MDKERKKIVVLGGYGAIGSRVCTALAHLPYVECVIAGRNPRRARRLAKSITASTLRIDVDNNADIQRHLADAFLVINTAGPFQAQTIAVAQFCAENGIHYIDVADDHRFASEVQQLNATAKRNNCRMVTAAASLPAMASVLVDSLADHFDRIDEIRVSALAGTRVPVGLGSVRTLLGKIGEIDRVKIRSRWREVFCWTGSQRVQFPAPLNQKRVYLYSIPAADQFARQYGIREATFRFGLQSGFLNGGLAFLGWLRRIGMIKAPARFARPLFAAARRIGRSGGSTYVVQVEVTGSQADTPVEHAAALLDAESDGLSLQTAMIVNIATRWIEQGTVDSGATSAIGMTSLEQLKPDLIERHVKLIRS